ncbi:MAG: LuxR C-terminal-related transcriptional regulator [Actinomycetota bacterium]
MQQLQRRTGSVIGRTSEVRAIAALLDRHRLVTLIGPGGVGKTTLAIEVIDEVEPEFDRVVTVELATARDEAAVLRLLASAATNSSSVELDQVVEALTARRTLVVFDNCEHLVEEVAQLVATVLAAGTTVVLATGRRPLLVADEVTWPVRPLDVPGDGPGPLTDVASVQLLLERIRQAVPTFELTEANRPLVAEICSAADGVPLTLELAAALARSRPLDEIVGALRDRPDRLGTARRDRPAHQRSLGASVDWSRRFLAVDDARLLDRLSVFVGSFSAAGARAVDAGDGAMGLPTLVEHSLVEFDPATERYRMLEVVRLDAESRLDDETRCEVARRHLDHCRRLAEEIGERMFEPDPDNVFSRYERELDNLAAAARFALDTDDIDGYRSLVGPVAPWWVHYQTPTDLRPWADVVDAEGAPVLWRANVRAALGFHRSHRGQYAEAAQLSAEATGLHAAADNLLGVTLGEVAAGNSLLALGRRDEARDAYLRGLEAADRSAHPYAELSALIALTRLDPKGPDAAGHLERARDVAAVGFGAIESVVVVELALLRLRQGRTDEARRLADDGLAKAERQGYAEIVASAACARAEVAMVDGDGRSAADLLDRALDLGLRQLHQGVIDRAEDGLARLAAVDDGAGSGRSAGGGGTAVPSGSAPAADEVALSDRELAVALLLRGDLTQREIADELYIAPSTVKTHIKSIYRKLGVSKRSAAVTRAADLGLFGRGAS